MSKVRWVGIVCLIALAGVALLAGGPAAAEDVENVTLSVTDRLHADQTEPLTVTAINASGETEDVTDEATLESDNESVVTVDDASLVPQGTGEAVITATYENDTDEATVTVAPPVTDLLDVWDRSLLPYRADTDDAALTVFNQILRFSSPDDEEVAANRDFLAVYEPGTITLDYNFATGASVHQEWNNEHVIVVGGIVPADTDPLTDPSTVAGLDGEGLQLLNEEVDFETITVDQLDGAGELDDIHYDVEAGQYATLVATIDDPADPTLTVEDGDIVVENESDIIGIEGFLVQERSAEVVPGSWLTPGTSLSFDIDTGLEGEHEHYTLFYDADTYMDSVKVLNVTDDLDEGLSSDDFLVEQDIAGVTGPVDVGTDDELLDLPVHEHNVIWPVSPTSVIGLTAANATYEHFAAESGELVLEAALASTGDRGNTSNTVQTDVDWEGSEYRWLHVAANETDLVATATGTVEPDHEAPDEIDLALESDVLTAGSSTSLSVTGTFENETSPLTEYATVMTNDSDRATVENDTLVADSSGEVSLTATFGDQTATATATVEPAPPRYNLTIPNDGGVYGIGIPGPSNGTLADAFADGTEGISAIYHHTGDGWELVTDLESEELDPLATYVMTTTGDGPTEVPMTIEFATDEAVENVTTGPGWALVPSPYYGDAESAYRNTSALLVLDRFDRPTVDRAPAVSTFSSYVVGATTWGEEPPALDAFGAYYVYLPEETALQVAVSNVTGLEEADSSLRIGD